MLVNLIGDSDTEIALLEVYIVYGVLFSIIG